MSLNAKSFDLGQWISFPLRFQFGAGYRSLSPPTPLPECVFFQRARISINNPFCLRFLTLSSLSLD